MPKSLAQRQLEATRRDADRDLRRKGRARLKQLREAVRVAKKARGLALANISASCRTARKQVSVRAQRARERLAASIKRTRERARNVCSAARGDANMRALAEIDRHLTSLQDELNEQRSLRLWAKPARLGGSKGSSARARTRERVAESDEEVAGNLDDPGLRVVWEQVKHRIKPSARRSRTEAFLEWAAEHRAEVYRLQEADAVRHLEELERREAALRTALRRKRPLTHADLDPVPF